MDSDGVVKKSWALLIFLRDLDVFFLGTAMLFLLFLVIHVIVPPFYLLGYLKILQRTKRQTNSFFAA